MKVQNIFYTIGVIFIIVSVIYFTREYIKEMPNSIKLVLLLISIIVAFIIAEFLRGGDK